MLYRTLVALCFCTHLFASDPIGIDSLFKQEKGLRSISSIVLLSSGNPHSYQLYPQINIQNPFSSEQDHKQLSLQQTLLYRLFSDFDVLLNASAV